MATRTRRVPSQDQNDQAAAVKIRIGVDVDGNAVNWEPAISPIELLFGKSPHEEPELLLQSFGLGKSVFGDQDQDQFGRTLIFGGPGSGSTCQSHFSGAGFGRVTPIVVDADPAV